MVLEARIDHKTQIAETSSVEKPSEEALSNNPLLLNATQLNWNKKPYYRLIRKTMLSKNLKYKGACSAVSTLLNMLGFTGTTSEQVSV